MYNLGPKGRRFRLLCGVVILTFTAVVAGFLARHDAHPLWRASILLPTFLGLIMLLQAKTRTCVALAMLGAWDLDCGMQRVPDRDLEKRLRHRAYALVLITFAAALLITLVFIAI